MQILVNTDNHITGREELTAQVASVVENTLDHFLGQITRVEVHLGDENSRKGGADDKRCMMEARLENRPPVAVTHHAGTLNEAMDGAAEKLKASLDSTIGRLNSR